MKVRFLLNEQLKKELDRREGKAVDLVKFLLTQQGVTTLKEDINKTSVSDLFVNGHKIIGAAFDTWAYEIELTLSEEVEPTAAVETDSGVKVGTQIIIINNGQYEIVTISGKIEIKGAEYYTIKEDNQIFSESEVIERIEKHAVLLVKLERQEQRRKEREATEQAERLEAEAAEKEYNNDYGFTSGKTDLQKRKILKYLNSSIIHNDNLTTVKKMIYNLINNNTCTTKEFFNTNRYSSKKVNGEYKKLKDKTEYRLYFNDTDFIELDKIGYQFANYLLTA